MSVYEGAQKKSPLDKIEGKTAERNGTKGKTEYEPPVDDAAIKDVDIPKEQLDKNLKRLRMKFKAMDDFFVLGRAGWGKTSIIKDFAEKFGYEVIIKYLDKCEATDLGGIPIAAKGKDGSARQQTLMPDFAQQIADNPDTKFLLFFDEMNQAAPDVMNALMPIVLDHKICDKPYENFFVGAAGNFESENSAVNELSGPLKSRFKPIIEWESDTDEAWSTSFNYLHKKYDDVISKTLVDLLHEHCTLFENPRELEQKLVKRYIVKMIQAKDNFDVDEWQDHIERLVKDELTRTQQQAIPVLAEAIWEAVKNGGKEESKSTGRSGDSGKNYEMMDESIRKKLILGIKNGFISANEGKDSNGRAIRVKYGISRENIRKINGINSAINAEMLERFLNKCEADGVKFRFEKDAEWKKAGYKDPNED